MPSLRTRKPNKVQLAPVGEDTPSDSISSTVTLGTQIRDLREARRVTLADLAERIGKSIGYLSQIERDQSEVSISALKAISDALGVRISWFFQGYEAGISNEYPYVVRREHRRQLSFPGVGVQEDLLSPNLNGESQLVMSTFQPGARSGEKLVSRMAEQSGLVISGELELQVGEKHFHLRSGDAFRIARGESFTARNAGDSQAVSLWVITPPIY